MLLNLSSPVLIRSKLQFYFILDHVIVVLQHRMEIHLKTKIRQFALKIIEKHGEIGTFYKFYSFLFFFTIFRKF
jgi:hypothetical protein